MSVTLRLDLTNVMQSSVGRNHGISEAQIGSVQRRTRQIHESLRRRRQAGELAFYDLPYMRESIIEVMSFAGEQIGRFENYVHVGSGGSSLGARALHGALNHPFHNYFPEKDRGGYPRLFFIDRLDPDTLSGLLAVIDPRRTLFHIVSKSGREPQINAGFLFFLAALKKRVGPNWRAHIIFTTDPESGDLHALARAERIKVFAIHPMVGERFLALSPAGLIPAALSGIDVHGLLHGAIEMDGACRQSDLSKNPAYLFGAAHFLLDTLKGKSQAKMLAGADCLAAMTMWFKFVWDFKPTRNVDPRQSVNQSHVRRQIEQAKSLESAPAAADNRVISFLLAGKFRRDTAVTAEFPQQIGFQAMDKLSAHQIVKTEHRAFSEALITARCPHLAITFPMVRPESIGEFVYMMHVASTYTEVLYEMIAVERMAVDKS
jgi:glucose-6-phosphate isomerase